MNDFIVCLLQEFAASSGLPRFWNRVQARAPIQRLPGERILNSGTARPALRDTKHWPGLTLRPPVTQLRPVVEFLDEQPGRDHSRHGTSAASEQSAPPPTNR